MTLPPDPVALDPAAAAKQLFVRHKGERAWLDAFAECLDRHRGGEALARTLDTWNLSQAEVARLLGVSRQAVGKWLERGVPPERAEMVADLAASTDLLVRYLKRDRIAAVVRRPIPAVAGLSLLQLLEQGRTREILASCRAMFSFEQAMS